MGFDQAELDAIFKALTESDKITLVKFARFLQDNRSETVKKPKITTPLDITRPKQETVIGALKRLRATYPMLSADIFMDQTAQLMTAHLIHGKKADVVIDEFELMFERAYQEFCDKMGYNTSHSN